MKRLFNYNENGAGREVLVDESHTGDCVIRAITLALDKPYEDVWLEFSEYTHFCPLTGATQPDYTEYLNTQGWEHISFKNKNLTLKQLHELYPNIWADKAIVSLYNHVFFIDNYTVHDYGDSASMGDFILDVCHVHVPKGKADVFKQASNELPDREIGDFPVTLTARVSN